ncbi:MAG TPA: hypothetical protein VMZ73_03445 [Acidimicrobiales bacterium]|nr:hypothetical protein [Acidimicrobiales bacterium]
MRRLGALAAPTVLSILAAGFYVASAEAATPKPLVMVSAPAPVVSEPVAQPPLAVEPVIETVAVAAVELEPAPAPEPAPEPEPEPCSDALDAVAAAGLPLPAGVGYRCPSTQFAHQGTACWDAWPCPGSSFIAINLDLGAGATPAYMRHVVAHEICHILDFRDRGWSTEPRADACAAVYGF